MSDRPYYSMLIEWSLEDQSYIVSFPEWEADGLIGHTHGETYEDAARKGHEVLHMLMESARANAEHLPVPRTFDRRYVPAGKPSPAAS
jgi:antitoxin HicB